MRYYQSKKYRESTDRLFDSKKDLIQDDAHWYDDRVELNDTQKFKREMIDSLQQYID